MSDGQTDKQPAAVEFSNLEPVDSRLSKSPEIAKLHKECAKYRTALKTSNEEKEAVQRQFDDLQQEYKRVLNSKREQEILHKLQIKGCKKPELALRDIPADCNDLDEFLSLYSKDNSFLFDKPKTKHGYSFRGGRASNYTPSQQMNNYIRSALGR